MWRKNFAWKMSSLLVGGGLAFVFQIVAMRYLGPRGYGYWSLAISWAGLFAVLVDYGFNPLLSRDIARNPSEARSYLRSVIKGKMVLAICAGVLLLLTWRYTPAVSLSGKLLLVAFLYLCCISTAESLQSITSALEKFRLGAALSVLQKALPALAGFFVIYTGGSELHLFIGVAALSFITVISSFFRIQREVRVSDSIKRHPLQPLLAAGLPLFLQNLFILVYFRVDTLMIGHYTTPDQAGLYGAAYRFFELSNVVPTALLAAWIAPLSKGIENKASVTQFYSVLKLFMGFALLGIFLLELLAWVSPHVLGPAYALARPVLMCLSLTLLFYFPNFLLTTMLVFLGKPHWNMVLAGFCAVFNIGANMWGIPRWGAFAAAWTTLATEGLLFIFSLLAVQRLFEARLSAKDV